jgi:glutathione S-transferase
MKLFYSKGSCALAPHIVMCEQNMVYELEAVNMSDKTCATGDYKKINPKGAVPALKMENGEYLTEGAIISQYLADQKNEGTLLGKFGTAERLRTLEWMNFIATDIHKNFSPLFGASKTYKSPETQNEVKAYYTELLGSKLNFVSEKLGTQEFLSGGQFTIADAYLFTCLSWTRFLGMSLDQWPNIKTYLAHVAERPSVVRAMKEQGLL